MILQLDHVAIGAERLEDGVAAVEKRLHAAMPEAVGRHEAMATHNRLLGLGPVYLEVIAVDPAAERPDWPRWFGLDAFSGPPRVVSWILRTDDLEAALARAPEGAGRPMALSRGDLRWRMAVPETGLLPFDGVFPALIEWGGAAHPADRLADSGWRIGAVELRHPRAGELAAALDRLGAGGLAEVRDGRAPRIAVHLTGPGGEVVTL